MPYNHWLRLVIIMEKMTSRNLLSGDNLYHTPSLKMTTFNKALEPQRQS
jgi:hypothetical protein